VGLVQSLRLHRRSLEHQSQVVYLLCRDVQHRQVLRRLQKRQRLLVRQLKLEANQRRVRLRQSLRNQFLLASAGITGTFDGNTSQTRWGPVQVRIVVKDGKIVAASALQSPNGDRRSADISRQAIPYLVQETLAAQSDQISGVGGATYTSNGWYTSLQSALKKAGL
jgi:uncharacterized protein with FMN-binding domain